MSNWEEIPERGMGGSERLRVPGGWIVRSHLAINGTAGKASVAIHQVFVADPTHEWEL